MGNKLIAAGWAIPKWAHRAHYFDEGEVQSLCGRATYFGDERVSGDYIDSLLGKGDCKKCQDILRDILTQRGLLELDESEEVIELKLEANYLIYTFKNYYATNMRSKMSEEVIEKVFTYNPLRMNKTKLKKFNMMLRKEFKRLGVKNFIF
ncbi:TPA: hypothetical protein NPY75_003184 [Escherichia coli]|nr:hypothetical protein [Escherichia coli]